MRKYKTYDAIVVLGGTHTPGYTFPKGRLDTAIYLYKKGYAPYIIVSDAGQTEIMTNYAVSRGVPVSSIIKESKARNTMENAYFVKDILEKRGWTRPLVVTSEVHTPRSKYHFEKILDKPYEAEFVTASSGVGMKKLVGRHFIEKMELIYTKASSVGISNEDVEKNLERDERITYSPVMKKLKGILSTLYNL